MATANPYSPHATKAWGRLQALFNKGLPTTIDATVSLNNDTLRTLRRHRRRR